jgi:diguanylate cyclase (GGDEF)-like protein
MRLARTRLSMRDVPLRLTISVGVATLPPFGSVRELVAMADAAMYEAKGEGRNRVR